MFQLWFLLSSFSPYLIATNFVFFFLLFFFIISAQNYGLTCFNCQGVSRTIDCNKVTRCSDGEECYIERVLQGSSTSYALWNMGCKVKQQCSVASTNSHVTCTKCCNGTLCNKEGCGIAGFGSPRGPVCYTCKSTETPQGCNEVRLCHKDEVCQLSRIAHDAALTNTSFFGSCVMKQACPSSAFVSNSIVAGKRRGAEIKFAKREITSKIKRADSGLCMHCCTTDVCNDMECSYTLPGTTTQLSTSIRPTTMAAIGWTSWLDWSDCTATCGGGSRFRIRSCTNNDPATKAITCPGNNIELGACNTKQCTATIPINGGWGAWGQWSNCPTSCGRSGIQHRFRHCDSPSPANGGQTCSGKPYDTKICNNGPCCTGPPSISHVSSDANVNIGETIILHCNATGHYTQIFWEGPKVVGHAFPDNVEAFDGGYTLVISRIRQENYGLYRCNVRNECGNMSKDVIVTTK